MAEGEPTKMLGGITGKGFPPGVSGNRSGRKKKPAWLAAKAEQALAWFAGFAAGTASDDAEKAFRRALDMAWAAGNLAARDVGPAIESVRKADVDRIMESEAKVVVAAIGAIEPSHNQLTAASKLIEWHYGKARVDDDEDAPVDVRVGMIRRTIIDVKALPPKPDG